MMDGSLGNRINHNSAYLRNFSDKFQFSPFTDLRMERLMSKGGQLHLAHSCTRV